MKILVSCDEKNVNLPPVLWSPERKREKGIQSPTVDDCNAIIASVFEREKQNEGVNVLLGT